MSIIDEIVEARKRSIARLGPSMGRSLPRRRTVPLVPFGRLQPGRDFFIASEVKRGSPSRGIFAVEADAVRQAGHYAKRGIKTLSVLTEETYFHGSLEDLFRIKNSFPDLCVMRKDFILDEDDITVSYRAGADAILLIASMHDAGTLGRLYRRAKSLGLEVLLEVHDREDLSKAALVQPDITGINSRNLATFRIDPAVPLALKKSIDWSTRTVFESGIRSTEDAAVALSGGFTGMLIGEGAMRDTDLIGRITALEREGIGDFWYRLFSSMAEGKPLVKICGITRERDARLAAELGAHVLGFIFADSPRCADPGLPERITDLKQLKVAVVVHGEEDRSIDSAVNRLLSEGCIDALQFHGDEHPDNCYRAAFPYYKALRIGGDEDVERIDSFHCPRVLVDAFVPGKPGGTGQRISTKLIESVRRLHPLWLAGGIGPDNVAEIISSFEPELIDASSRLESEPGTKDSGIMVQFFKEIEGICKITGSYGMDTDT